MQFSTVDKINITADRQKFMTLTGELSWAAAPETISRSRDGCARQNLNGSPDLTTPLSGMPYQYHIHRLASTTDNLVYQPNLKFLSSLTTNI